MVTSLVTISFLEMISFFSISAPFQKRISRHSDLLKRSFFASGGFLRIAFRQLSRRNHGRGLSEATGAHMIQGSVEQTVRDREEASADVQEQISKFQANGTIRIRMSGEGYQVSTALPVIV
jgi:hypothetical protein